MTRISYSSRHPLTPAQLATIEAAWPGAQVKQVEIVFQLGQVHRQLSDQDPWYLKGDGRTDVWILVAPMWVHAAALRGYNRTAEFANEPSARQRGVFLCKGLHVYHPELNAPGGVRWVECPVPLVEQEESSLNYPTESR